MIDTVAKKAKDSFPRKRTDHVRSRQLMADNVAPLDDLDREIIAEVKQLREEREQDERTIQLIPIRQLERHPSNRTIDPLDPSIMSLAESIRENGQLDPMRVRQLAEHRYQLISGERRYTAIKVHLDPAYLARCIVVHIDDAAALREVAVANSNREDLNAVQRAELMQQLMLPKSEGGSGQSLIEAGKLFGLSSESGCKNAIRILKLPKAVTNLIKSGELPERAARRLVPFCSIAKIEKTIVDAFKHMPANFIAELLDEKSYPRRIEHVIDRELRPISSDLKHDYYYPTGAHGCLFDWEANKAELQIVDLPYPVGPGWDNRKIEMRKFAKNAKLWDKLNAPLIKQAIERREKKGKPKAAAAAGKKLTAAQVEAEEKRKAKESDEQFDKFSREWLCRLMRCSISELTHDVDFVMSTLPWLVSHCDQSEVNEANESAIAECTAEPIKTKPKRSYDYNSHGDGCLYLLPLKTKWSATKILCEFWRVILWPVSLRISDSPTQLTPAGKLPENLIKFGYSSELKHVLRLAELGKVTLSDAWHDAATDGTDQRRLVSVWLLRHTKEQLQRLATELKVSASLKGASSRGDMATCILSSHKPGKPLPVPKRLSKLVK